MHPCAAVRCQFPLFLPGWCGQVLGPPRSTGHAQRITAEHFAFCDECAGHGLSDIPRITASLLHTAIWTFWRD